MSEKHQIFIESMVKMSKVSPTYVEPLKAITKCYIINEGLYDSVARIMHGGTPCRPGRTALMEATGSHSGTTFKDSIDKLSALFPQYAPAFEASMEAYSIVESMQHNK
jgi:hypothetical protein